MHELESKSEYAYDHTIGIGKEPFSQIMIISLLEVLVQIRSINKLANIL